MMLNVHRETVRLIRDGEKGVEEEGDYIPMTYALGWAAMRAI